MKLNVVLMGALGIMLVMGACAAPEQTKEKTQAERLADKGFAIEAPVDSIPNYELSSWNYLDPHGIILKSGPSRRYLVTFSQRCSDLRWVEVLATTSTVNRLTKFDKVLARRPGGGMPRQCQIAELYLLNRIAQPDDEPAK